MRKSSRRPRATLDIEVGGFNANSDVWNFFERRVEIDRVLPQSERPKRQQIQDDEVMNTEALGGNSEKHSKGSTTISKNNGHTDRPSGSMQPTQPQPVPLPIPVSVPDALRHRSAPLTIPPTPAIRAGGRPPTLARPGYPATFGRNLLPLPRARLRNPPVRALLTQPKVKQRSPQSLTRELSEIAASHREAGEQE